MDVFKPLRTALCVYEGLRFVFLIGAFITIQPEGIIVFPWLSTISPGALFFLMALFGLLNTHRFQIYYQLYLAGKGLSLTATIFWLLFTRSDALRELLFSEMAWYIVPGIVIFFMLGDLLSTWIAIKLMNS